MEYKEIKNLEVKRNFLKDGKLLRGIKIVFEELKSNGSCSL